MVSQVARIVGGESENNIRAQSLDCLNRVRMELNMHDWRFLKTTVTSTAFVNGTQTYALPAAFKSPSFFRLLDSNGKPYRDLTYYDDATFSHLLPIQSQTGAPWVYTLRNAFADGLISFYPVPDAGAVGNYTWAGEYYALITQITDSSASNTGIPEMMFNVLVLGGQAYLLRERDKANPATQTAHADFMRIKNLALVADRRATDETPRFRLPSNRSLYPRTVAGFYGWPWF